MNNYEQKLAEAALKIFSRPVTGFFLDARIKGEGVRGAIFKDSLNRYEDGDTFTTSPVQQTWSEHGYTLFATEAGSCYVAVTHLMFVEENFEGVPQMLIFRAS
ncbi:hypothetical protein NPS29_00945 [Pseudomonas putida]|uniref:hypothetical protein n=1 Tax=Pseudomonas putida TaxID=303 RepID=UPI00236464D9|nr:hypothetical protein [Pseudomonas putida]MDD1963876.1 hypothetical protein [Pseudomonas putida]